MFWLESIKYIDLDDMSLINTAFTVGHVSRGAITLSDLKNMTYTVFAKTRSSAMELIKKMEDDDV